MGFAKRQSLLAEEVFSNSMANVHAGIPETLGRMVGIKTLTIGYTKDIELAETFFRKNLGCHTKILRYAGIDVHTKDSKHNCNES